MAKDQLFFVGQKAFINNNDQILVLILPDGKLDFPGGKIQENETDLDTSFKREIKEETGLDIKIEHPFYRWYFEFNPQHAKAGQKVFLIGIKCKYLGGDITLSNEHSQYKWVNKNTYNEVNDNSQHFLALDAYFKSLT